MIQGRLSASFALLATFVLAGCATPAEKEQRVLAQLSAPGSPNAPEKGVLLLIAKVNGQECDTDSG
jgi:hypothetical protein